MKKVKIIPLVSESLGARSMCTFVSSPDINILIDPGISLSKRFSLYPHPIEYRLLKKYRAKILEYAEKADIITLSHYHFDHSTPTFTDYVWNWSTPETTINIYQGKTVLTKDIRSNINYSQRRRGWLLKKKIRKYVKTIEPADGRVFTFGDTTIEFSKPVFHGELNTPLGFVLMTIVKWRGESFVHASDVQGPLISETLNKILSFQPNNVMIAGPPLYLKGTRILESQLKMGIKNLSCLASKVPITIVDHHLLRDKDWKVFARPAFNAASKCGNRLLTVAEYLSLENVILESKRRELYKSSPPSVKFTSWTNLKHEEQRANQPPL